MASDPSFKHMVNACLAPVLDPPDAGPPTDEQLAGMSADDAAAVGIARRKTCSPRHPPHCNLEGLGV